MFLNFLTSKALNNRNIMSVESVHNDPLLQRENTQWLITRASGGRRRKRVPGTGTSSASSSQRWSSHSSVSYRTSYWPQQRRAALEKLQSQCYSFFILYILVKQYSFKIWCFAAVRKHSYSTVCVYVYCCSRHGFLYNRGWMQMV